MTDEPFFQSESTKTPAEIASLFHYLGDCLRAESHLAFHHDNRTTTIPVPSEVTVSVEVESETESDHSETEVEIELEWLTDDTDGEQVTTEESGGSTSTDTVENTAQSAESLTPADEGRASLGRFEVYRDRVDEWRWRLVHRNGNTIATSGEGYTTRQNAEKGLRSVMVNAPGADVTTANQDQSKDQ